MMVVLSIQQRRLLRGALAGRMLAACFSTGAESAAILVMPKLAGRALRSSR
jgi:hypothetical protein